MRHSLRLSALFVVPLLLVVAGIQAGNSGAASTAIVKTAPAHILVNAKGMTLYIFSKDSKNMSTCTGGCAKIWPPLMVPKGMKAPAKMAGIPGTFGTTMRAGGGEQLTYDGAPLYTFAKDMKPGDLTGQGVGSIWWAVVIPGNGM